MRLLDNRAKAVPSTIAQLTPAPPVMSFGLVLQSTASLVMHTGNSQLPCDGRPTKASRSYPHASFSEHRRQSRVLSTSLSHAFRADHAEEE